MGISSRTENFASCVCDQCNPCGRSAPAFRLLGASHAAFGRCRAGGKSSSGKSGSRTPGLSLVLSLVLLLLGLISGPAAFAAPVQVLAVNAGGGAAGSFAADAYVQGGTAADFGTGVAVGTAGVASPAPQGVYQTERWGDSTYTLPGLTPGASYTLRLHFAELYFTAVGQRQFNVFVNGAQVLTNFDILAAAGGMNKAVVESFPVTASASGQIVVQFTHGAATDPKVSGLEVWSAPPAAPAGLTATAGNASVALSWNAVAGATSYSVYRGTSSGGETLLTSGLTATSYTNTGLTNGTTYFYQVTAVSSAGESAKSSETSATPAVPTATASFVGFDAGTQGNWKSVYGADGYSVSQDARTPARATPACLPTPPSASAAAPTTSGRRRRRTPAPCSKPPPAAPTASPPAGTLPSRRAVASTWTST